MGASPPLKYSDGISGSPDDEEEEEEEDGGERALIMLSTQN